MQNKISVAIKIIGIIAILAGVITFFVFASHDYLLQGAIYLVSCIAGGLLIAGFGEIISLLQASYDTLSKIYSDKKIYINKNSESKDDRKPKNDELKCPHCGTINANYVGSCGCGYEKHTQSGKVNKNISNVCSCDEEKPYSWTCPKCGKVNQSTSDVDVCSCGYSPMN